VLLGLVIEATSGQTYARYLQDTFFDPLGLTATRVATGAEIPEGLVRGYHDDDEDGEYDDWTAMDMAYVWSAGCVIATARDVAVWMDTLVTGEIVSEPWRQDLFAGQPIAPGVTYGAGLLIDETVGIGHNGTVIGYHADAWHDPETGATVAVLANTNAPLLTDNRDPTREIALGVLELLRRDPHQRAHHRNSLDSETPIWQNLPGEPSAQRRPAHPRTREGRPIESRR